MTLALRLLTSRTGLIVMAALAALTWWQWDKRHAIKKAVAEYVAASELAAKDAVIKELAHRGAVAKRLNEELKQQITQAQTATLMAEKELEEYAEITPATDQCVSDAEFLNGLRTN